jgi:hypothetical protein
VVVTALGVVQILAWGLSFYLLGVLANPKVCDTGWGYEWITAGYGVACFPIAKRTGIGCVKRAVSCDLRPELRIECQPSRRIGGDPDPSSVH